MQVSRLSILVLITFLIGCASPITSREEADAAAILSGSSEVAGETKTAEEIEEEAQKTITRANFLGEVRCAIAIPCPQTKVAKEDQTIIGDLWWTWKYAMWGQGSSKDWPWAW